MSKQRSGKHDRPAWPRDLSMADFNRVTNGTGGVCFEPHTSPGGAAARMGVTRQRVHQMILSGELRAYRVFEEGSQEASYTFVLDEDVTLQAAMRARIRRRA